MAQHPFHRSLGLTAAWIGAALLGACVPTSIPVPPAFPPLAPAPRCTAPGVQCTSLVDSPPQPLLPRGQGFGRGYGAGSPASCDAPQRHDCSFYAQCLEKRVPCGRSGYALGFGDRYCNAFKQAQLSPRGEAWVDAVMLCLQRQLVPYATSTQPAPTCDQITQSAFDSHTGCYTDPAESICFLPAPDAMAVVDTIGAGEMFTARTQKQVQSVAATCAVQIGDRLASGGLAPLVATVELTEQLAVWEQLALRAMTLP